MHFRKEKQLIARLPILTLLVASGALMAYASAGLSALLVYDRALILEGQYWRLLTFGFTHFEWRHLLFNLLPFAAAGGVLESINRLHFALLLLILATVIGPSLLAAKAGMALYGGLSGLVYGSFYYLALSGLGRREPWRRLAWLILLLIPLKIILDSVQGNLLISSSPYRTFVPVWESHALGVTGALLYFHMWKFFQSRTGIQSAPAQ